MFRKGLKLATCMMVSALSGMTANLAQADELPPYVRIRNVSYAGSGCPAGTVYGNLGSLYRGLKIEFDGFVAEAGSGVPLSASRKNCQISISLDVPAGWSFAVASVEYKGYVSLSSSSLSAEQKSSYYFAGSAATASLSTSVRGPIARNYTIRDTLAISNQLWSPCGANRALNLNAQVRVAGSRGYGIMTLDSIAGKVEHLYGLSWRRC